MPKSLHRFDRVGDDGGLSHGQRRLRPVIPRRTWIVWVIAMAGLGAAIVTAGRVAAPVSGDASYRSVVLPGATLVSLPLQGQGRLVVTSLQTHGPGSAAGLHVGDRIEAIDGVPIDSAGAISRFLARDGHNVLVLHVRRGRSVLDIRLPKAEEAS